MAAPNARTERRPECGAEAAALSSCRDACKLFAPVTGWAADSRSMGVITRLLLVFFRMTVAQVCLGVIL
jgi:hypothetical protein